MDSKYQAYADLLRSKLSDYRLNHSLEVAKSAVYLAEKYGGDCEKMYLAGLLHDILKEADKEETFLYVEKYKIELPENYFSVFLYKATGGFRDTLKPPLFSFVSIQN